MIFVRIVYCVWLSLKRAFGRDMALNAILCVSSSSSSCCFIYNLEGFESEGPFHLFSLLSTLQEWRSTYFVYSNQFTIPACRYDVLVHRPITRLSELGQTVNQLFIPGHLSSLGRQKTADECNSSAGHAAMALFLRSLFSIAWNKRLYCFPRPWEKKICLRILMQQSTRVYYFLRHSLPFKGLWAASSAKRTLSAISRYSGPAG